MKPTSMRLLVPLLVVAASIGWSLARLVQHWTEQMTVVGWSMPTTMAILAAALLIWTLLARPRLLRKPGHAPLAPLAAARSAAMALAASRVGTLAAGIHLGLAVALLPSRTAPSAREELLIAGLTFVFSACFTAVGWWLEVLCRVKGDSGDGSGLTPKPDGAAGSTARSSLN